jgi:hypothetical protein
MLYFSYTSKAQAFELIREKERKREKERSRARERARESARRAVTERLSQQHTGLVRSIEVN